MKPPAAQLRPLRVRGGSDPAPEGAPEGAAAAAHGTPRRPGSLTTAVLVCFGLAAASLLFPSTPTYDPWAWLLWGREIVDLDLNTHGGPSWKPLPVLFTVPFSLLGDDVAPHLWLLVARAGGLLSCVMCFRVVNRLSGGGIAGAIGGLAAAALLLTSFNFLRDAALGNSEALMVALVLWAFERHLDGRRAQALYLGFAAALLRPEVWPFLGAYGLFLLLREPALRLRTAILGALIPVLWFGPELWGSGSALRAATRANDPNRGSAAFADNPTMELFERFKDVLVTPVKIGAAVAIVWALVAFLRNRRHGPVLAVFGAGVAWFGLVAFMTEQGFAGNQRYLIISTAAFTVLAGVGGALALAAAMRGAERASDWRHAGVAALALAVVAGGVLGLPVAKKKVDNGERTIDGLRYEGSLWPDLKDVIGAAGGPDRLKACGGMYSGPFQTQMVAYELGVHGEAVRSLEGTPPPGVAFRTRTVPTGPLVIKLTDVRYQEIVRRGKWRVVTVPPTGSTSCPKAAADSPTVAPRPRGSAN